MLSKERLFEIIDDMDWGVMDNDIDAQELKRLIDAEPDNSQLKPLVMLVIPKIAEVEEKYNELIMAVANKFTNETRHQTALRYIKMAEQITNDVEGKETVENRIKELRLK